MGRKFGEFSLIKADRNGKYANIGKNETVKMLIPQKFGGGFIKGKFGGTGLITENGINYSIYELAGIWNSKEMFELVKEMGYDNPARKNYVDSPVNDKITERIQNVGIMYTIYDENHVRAEYPIKIVSEDCDMTYEECAGISLYDKNVGIKKWEWKDWQKIFGNSTYEETIEKVTKNRPKWSEKQMTQYIKDTIKKIKEIKETD